MSDGSEPTTAGNPGAAGAPGDGGQTGAPQTGNPGTQPSTGGAGEGGKWFESLPQEVRGVAEAKGWLKDDPVEALNHALTSYSQLERHIGVPPDRLLKLPGKDAKPEDWQQVLRQLGAPEDPKGYDLAPPEGVDPEAFETIRTLAAKAGMLPQQMSVFVEAYQQMVREHAEQAQIDAKAKRQELMGELRKEYGEAFDAKLNLARQAAKAFDVDAKLSSQIEQVLGSADLVRFFVNLGERMGEASFRDGDTGTGGFSTKLSPSEARAEWSRLQADESFMKQLMDPRHPAHQEALARRKRLFEAMNPE